MMCQNSPLNAFCFPFKPASKRGSPKETKNRRQVSLLIWRAKKQLAKMVEQWRIQDAQEGKEEAELKVAGAVFERSQI